MLILFMVPNSSRKFLKSLSFNNRIKVAMKNESHIQETELKQSYDQQNNRKINGRVNC